MSYLREQAVKRGYYEAHATMPEPKPWEQLTPEEQSFYYRACSAVWLEASKEIDTLRHQLLMQDIDQGRKR